jgi:hypothetical protein
MYREVFEPNARMEERRLVSRHDDCHVIRSGLESVGEVDTAINRGVTGRVAEQFRTGQPPPMGERPAAKFSRFG